LKTRRFCRAR